MVDAAQVLDDVAERGEVVKGKIEIDIPQRSSHAKMNQGTEMMAWLGTVPLLATLIIHVTRGLLTYFPSSHPLVSIGAAYLWYALLILTETALKLSPTLRYIAAVNRKESTEQMMQRIKESSTVRLEVHMTSLKALEPFAGTSPDETVPCEVSWGGKTVFPAGSTRDATLVPEEILACREAWIRFETKLQFLDDRSRQEFQRHVDKFIAANSSRGDTFELTQHLVVPGVPEQYELLSYGDVQGRPPIRSSKSGFFVFTLFGLTLPFRLAAKYTLPQYNITVVKQMSSIWRASSVNLQSNPNLDFGA
jgi:hypothetical protein